MFNKKILIIVILIGSIFLLSACSLFPNQAKFGYISKGVYKSEDKGVNWLEKNNIEDSTSTIKGLNVHKMQFDIRDSRIIYLATNKGLYLSQNSAETWKNILPHSNIFDFVLNPKTRGIIYVIIGNQVYKTSDDGKNWELIYTETRKDSSVASLAISYFDTSKIYLLTTQGTLMVSTDWGSSWKFVYDFKTKTNKLFINPSNTQNMYVSVDNGLYYTHNNGVEWREIVRDQTKYFPGIDQFRDLLFTEQGELIYVCKYGILRSKNNGESWKDLKLVSPPGSVEIGPTNFNPKNSDEIYYVVGNILYHTLDGGQNWITKVLPVSNKVRASQLLVDFYNPKNLYLGLTQ